MAHFAELDENNYVLRVVVVDNFMLRTADGEDENLGIKFCKETFGGCWVQTSYNSSFRKNYAAKGFLYDKDKDAFIPPQPYESWTLDEDLCVWLAPVPYPTDDNLYSWDEDSQQWILTYE